MINRALQEKPANAENWSVRWPKRGRLFGIKPHLAQTFKLSTDPFFIEKVRERSRCSRDFHHGLLGACAVEMIVARKWGIEARFSRFGGA